MNLDFKVAGGILAAVCVLSFAGGRYTMRQTVEKEASVKYEEKLKQTTEELQTKYAEQLKQETEQIRQRFEQTVDRTTTKKPDGTTIVTEHTKTKESSSQDKTSKEKTAEKTVDSSKSTTDSSKSETSRSSTITTPPPSWRAYAATAVTAPMSDRRVSYGAGGMYDFGPLNAGGFGLYSPQANETTLGITLGISF